MNTAVQYRDFSFFFLIYILQYSRSGHRAAIQRGQQQQQQVKVRQVVAATGLEEAASDVASEEARFDGVKAIGVIHRIDQKLNGQEPPAMRKFQAGLRYSHTRDTLSTINHSCPGYRSVWSGAENLGFGFCPNPRILWLNQV